MPTAWSLLSLDDADRQFAGNEGYADELGRCYVWDSTVPNARRVRAGDLAVVRDRDFVLGVGWIDGIQTWEGTKQRFRCSNCGRTGFKERTTIRPRYRCGECKTTFDEPAVEWLTGLDFFRADYTETWTALYETVTVADVQTAYRTNASQHAIRELDLGVLREIIDRLSRVRVPW